MELPLFSCEAFYLQSMAPSRLSFICRNPGLISTSPLRQDKAVGSQPRNYCPYKEAEKVFKKFCSPQKGRGRKTVQKDMRVGRETNAKEERRGSKGQNPLW